MSVTIDPSNVCWSFSPGNWDSNGSGSDQENNVKPGSTWAQSVCPGAEFATIFDGGSCVLSVDTSMLSGVSDMPAIDYQVDGGSKTRYQLQAADTSVTVATGLSNAPHTLAVNFIGASQGGDDRWNTPVQCVRVTGLTAPNGFAVPTVPTRSLLVFGDSNTEGREALGLGGDVAHQDASIAYARLLGPLLNLRVGSVGFSSQGISVTGTGNVPECVHAWDLYSLGRSRRTMRAPFALLCNHGINDENRSADVTADTATLIAAWRALWPGVFIFITVPWTGQAAAQLAAGVAAVGDPRTYFVNTNRINYDASDFPYHLSGAQGHPDYAVALATLIRPNLSIPRVSRMRA